LATGRLPLIAFAALPIGGILYALMDNTGLLVAIQRRLCIAQKYVMTMALGRIDGG
jgi:hypothetical protein